MRISTSTAISSHWQLLASTYSSLLTILELCGAGIYRLLRATLDLVAQRFHALFQRRPPVVFPRAAAPRPKTLGRDALETEVVCGGVCRELKVERRPWVHNLPAGILRGAWSGRGIDSVVTL